MTREEAIRRIQDFMHWFKKDMPVYESLEMAIRILENHDEFMKRAYEQGYQDGHYDGYNSTLIEDKKINSKYNPKIIDPYKEGESE